MKKVLGIAALLLAILIAMWIVPETRGTFWSAYNLENVLRWSSLFGIISIGVAFVIITGGIDLSIGSVIGLVGAMMPLLLIEHEWPAWLMLTFVMSVALAIGLAHGLLITRLRLQPFVVTLCGLLLYRGIARWITGDKTTGFGTEYNDSLRLLATWEVPLPFMSQTAFAIPITFLILVIVAVFAGVFLNYTVWGRYLFALGRNEEAARFSGIHTDRMIILAYVVSAGLAGLGGVLFALDVNVVQPVSHGNFYELYAIAAAVLGGCSLRGGEGSIIGVIIGAAIMRVLYNAINLLGIATQLEFAIIGGVILIGVIVDEIVKRFVSARRARARSP